MKQPAAPAAALRRALSRPAGAAACVAALAAIGGLAGAGADADTRAPGYVARTELRLDVTAPELLGHSDALQARLRYLTAVARSPQAIAGTSLQTGLPVAQIVGSTQITQAPGALVFTSHAARGAVASAQVSAFASQTLSAAVLGLGPVSADGVSIGDFEGGNGRWRLAGEAADAFPGAELDTVRSPQAHSGDAVLQLRCRQAAGCGAAGAVSAPFEAGKRYVVTAWVRAAAGQVRATLVAGDPPADAATSRPVLAGGTWQELQVSWTPARSTSIAGVEVDAVGRFPARVQVDSVSLQGLGASLPALPAPLSAPREILAADRLDYAVQNPTETILRTGRVPAVAALAGLGAGALAGLSGALGARAARRRRLRSAIP